VPYFSPKFCWRLEIADVYPHCSLPVTCLGTDECEIPDQYLIHFVAIRTDDLHWRTSKWRSHTNYPIRIRTRSPRVWVTQDHAVIVNTCSWRYCEKVTSICELDFLQRFSIYVAWSNRICWNAFQFMQQLKGNPFLFPQILHWHEFPGRIHKNYLRTAQILINSIFSYIYILHIYRPLTLIRPFGETCCLHLQGRAEVATCFILVPCFSYFRLWSWRRKLPPKRLLVFNRLDGVISQKIRTLLNHRCEKLICIKMHF
jgi:hypothetical protein